MCCRSDGMRGKMKFRYRILLVNIIVLSLGLGVVGYLMIRRNFDLVREAQLRNAIIENNLIQSSVEYELLQQMNSENTGIKKMRRFSQNGGSRRFYGEKYVVQ